MKLTIVSPSEIFELGEIEKIIAEGEKGYFCLLPHHIDYVTAIVPGILSYEQAGKGETFMAVDEGILVKKGPEVKVSTRNVIPGGELGSLKKAVGEKMMTLDDLEKKTRAILVRLEADFAKRFKEMK